MFGKRRKGPDVACCDNCRFFQKEEITVGRCLRFPPVLKQTEEGLRSCWPWVEIEEWCGEWSWSAGITIPSYEAHKRSQEALARLEARKRE